MDGPLIVDEQTFEVRDGELATTESWIYVWLRPGLIGEVLYIGATRLPPAARFWLHLHHDDPILGRVRAEHPEALSGDIEIRAFRLNPALDRKSVKQAVAALLNDEQLDHVDDDTAAAADAIVARLANHA